MVGRRGAFGDQYLWMEGTAASEPGPGTAAPDEVMRLAAEFEPRTRERQDAIRARIDGVAAGGGTCVLWGAGAKGVTLLNALGLDPDQVSLVVDLNPRKQGAFVAGTGHEIVAPEALRDLRPDTVLVTNPNYRGEVADAVSRLGLDSDVVSIQD